MRFSPSEVQGGAPRRHWPEDSFVRPSPLLDEIGQALAGRHHREDVLLLGDLEPDECRAVDRLGRADRLVDLVRRRGALKLGIPNASASLR